jgi:hypothetical protein
MWAMLAPEVFEFTRPMYSSISLGLFPAAVMRVACGISVGMGMRIPEPRISAGFERKEYNKSF